MCGLDTPRVSAPFLKQKWVNATHQAKLPLAGSNPTACR